MKLCMSVNRKHSWAWLRNIEVMRISIRGCRVSRKTAIRGLYRCSTCDQTKEGRTQYAPASKNPSTRKEAA